MALIKQTKNGEIVLDTFTDKYIVWDETYSYIVEKCDTLRQAKVSLDIYNNLVLKTKECIIYREIEDFKGEHVLTGIDLGAENPIDKNAEAVIFQLDGRNYLATENPEDGYRSMLNNIQIVATGPANVIPPVKVIGRVEDCILTLYDKRTNREIFQLGTDYSDDYYPCFVCNWNPENLILNQKVEAEEKIHADAREATARQTFKAMAKTNRPDVAIAILLQAIDDWYEKGLIHGKNIKEEC